MNALPGIYVQWDESAEPLESFIRYQVYRRQQGETDAQYVALAKGRITDRSRSYFTDYAAGFGIVYEYTVTVVADVAGEEVEGDFATSVQAELESGHLWLHDVDAPENYAEIRAQAQQMAPVQDIQYLQSFSGQRPSAHVGNVEQEVYSVSLVGQWGYTAGDISEEQWRAVMTLRTRQRTHGAVLCARQTRDVRLFCVMEEARRSDTSGQFDESIRLREVEYSEAVS